ncbi:MMPL family transporter [Ornithinibacter aureus]|uniref:MMPL family transporter n=1 Tax=Ornithinibacter aureus TaxID=622664 RepID=A0ABP8K9E0_9MICO|nr:MMPL family transporter [Ornithinibacter aureus]KAF0834256.1 RND superfamily putative drug exporter [Ornithinibacter aureus]
MSTALYRLGRWCATHARRVLVLWLVVLVGAGALAATISQPLGNGFTIPGANFEKVRQQLGEEIPEAAGGFGTVVLSSDTAFTPAQRAAVEDVFAAWGQVPNVSRVINPFEAQDQLDAGQAQLADAKKQLDAGQKGIEQGQAELTEGEGQLAAGEAVLEQLEETNPQDPSIPGLRAQLAQGRAELEKGRADLDKGIAELAAGRAAYEDGVAISRATDGTRLVSQDGRYAVAQVQFDTDAQSVPVENRAMIPDSAKAALAAAGVNADYSVEITQDTALVGAGEIIGLTVALLVLVAVLGSLVAAGLPLLVALLGVGVGLGGAIAFTAVTELNQMTPALALMLGLAVGIDYALFIVTRHRTSLLHGQDLVESISRAVGTAGSAVVFAGLTVVIALTALVLSGLPILAEMGLVAAFTVAVTVLVAVTVSPALLRLMGTRVISRRGWRAAGFATPGDPTSRTTPDDGTDEEHGGWFVRLVTLRPWLTVLAVVGVLGVLAIPVGSIQLGLPDGGREPTGTTAHTAYTTVGEQFGPGINGPIVAVTTLPEELRPTDEASLANVQAMIATRLKVIDGVRSVVPFGVSPDQATLAFQVVPTTGPADPATAETFHRVEFTASQLERRENIKLGLTGQTVANIEVSERLAAALPAYLAVVVGLSVLILLLVFRSLVVPLIATGGFLLSIAAAFGATVAVHQWGWLGAAFGVHQAGPLLSVMPIIIIGVLFGLAMDYQMFLVSGMHEARSHGQDSRTAVRTGFVHGAKVVTAAAIIMTSVFLGFAFSHLAMVRPIGFALAVGVLLDAVLVRMTLTPALMHLLGDRAWYLPRWLDRILPDLDVEGVRLAERLDSGALGSVTPAPPTPVPTTT